MNQTPIFLNRAPRDQRPILTQIWGWPANWAKETPEEWQARLQHVVWPLSRVRGEDDVLEIMFEHEPCLRTLLEKGLSPDARFASTDSTNATSVSLLQQAVRNHRADLVELLLRHGAAVPSYWPLWIMRRGIGTSGSRWTIWRQQADRLCNAFEHHGHTIEQPVKVLLEIMHRHQGSVEPVDFFQKRYRVNLNQEVEDSSFDVAFDMDHLGPEPRTALSVALDSAFVTPRLLKWALENGASALPSIERRHPVARVMMSSQVVEKLKFNRIKSTQKLLGVVQILHDHGQLGDWPAQGVFEPPHRPQDAELDEEAVKQQAVMLQKWWSLARSAWEAGLTPQRWEQMCRGWDSDEMWPHVQGWLAHDDHRALVLEWVDQKNQTALQRLVTQAIQAMGENNAEPEAGVTSNAKTPKSDQAVREDAPVAPNHRRWLRALLEAGARPVDPSHDHDTLWSALQYAPNIARALMEGASSMTMARWVTDAIAVHLTAVHRTTSQAFLTLLTLMREMNPEAFHQGSFPPGTWIKRAMRGNEPLHALAVLKTCMAMSMKLEDIDPDESLRKRANQEVSSWDQDEHWIELRAGFVEWERQDLIAGRAPMASDEASVRVRSARL